MQGRQVKGRKGRKVVVVDRERGKDTGGKEEKKWDSCGSPGKGLCEWLREVNNVMRKFG